MKFGIWTLKPSALLHLQVKEVTRFKIKKKPFGREGREKCETLKRRCSSRTFPYGYLVTTSPQSPGSPSPRRSGASGAPGSHGVTGGEYRARERIHHPIADR